MSTQVTELSQDSVLKQTINDLHKFKNGLSTKDQKPVAHTIALLELKRVQLKIYAKI